MIDITQYLPGKRKLTPSGWISFNAPCCAHNGQSADHRLRGGLKASDQGWSYHCFNCGYTASFILGRSVSFKARRLLSWFGVADRDIELLNLESMRHRSVYGIIEDRQRTLEALQGITFEERELPAGAEFVEPDSEYADYLQKRCVPRDFPFMKDPLVTRRGIIIPFTYCDQVVGWTKRFLDDRNPRYLSDAQPGYVFNVDSIKDSWTQVIVTEGIFDALSIGGVAVMHNDINDAQARLIRNLGREITVVPDQDKTGLDLIDRALELGWAVSIPDWGDCKDINDAVIKYGRLAALITIMQARETSRIKIELRKRQLIKFIGKFRENN
jgi:hypothetical protein